MTHETNDLDPVTAACNFLTVDEIVIRGKLSLWIIPPHLGLHVEGVQFARTPEQK